MAPSTTISGLIPMSREDLTDKLLPQVFVALDLDTGRQVVGTFLHYNYADGVGVVLRYANSPDPVRVSVKRVTKAYYAPMGYRPPAPSRS